MIFAHPDVRDFIAAAFVPAWESVREVPTVVIDFGGGRTLKRTVNGNVATYVCTPDGRVVDILPGLSTPEAYLQDLRAALALVNLAPEDVAAHHGSGGILLSTMPLDVTKLGGIEPRIKTAIGVVDAAKTLGIEPPTKSLILSDRALLEADTRGNREIRKPKVHALLAERSWTSKELTKRVYREILDCDLDDPYLGLGQAAFGGGAYGRP